MAVFIREVVSEITLINAGQRDAATAPTNGLATPDLGAATEERIVRRAVARVLEQLRTEWDG